MSPQRPRKPPVPIVNASNLIGVTKRSTTASQASKLDQFQAVKAQKVALHDLVGNILVGPPMFPTKPSTGETLFGVALDQLDRHDKTTAEALRRYASHIARMEILDLKCSTLGLSSADAAMATLRWLVEPPVLPLHDIREGFNQYKNVIGKRSCHLRTLRRQHELLCGYGGTHKYPKAHNRDLRPAWVRDHLTAMIAEAQAVSCWHSQSDVEMHSVMLNVDRDTPLTQLSLLLLAELHRTTAGYLKTRLLPRRRL